jgi:hypothetical protein
MHPFERRYFVRPLIALIERIVDGDTDSISASSPPAKANPHPVHDDDYPSLDGAEDFGPR